jgi:hypothetical protein
MSNVSQGLICPWSRFLHFDGCWFFMTLSTFGRRAAGEPCVEDGLGAVIAGSLLADEAAPSRDFSYSDLYWDAICGAAGPLLGTHLYLSLTSSCPCWSRSCRLVDIRLVLAGWETVEGCGTFGTLIGAR